MDKEQGHDHRSEGELKARWEEGFIQKERTLKEKAKAFLSHEP